MFLTCNCFIILKTHFPSDCDKCNINQQEDRIEFYSKLKNPYIPQFWYLDYFLYNLYSNKELKILSLFILFKEKHIKHSLSFDINYVKLLYNNNVPKMITVLNEIPSIDQCKVLKSRNNEKIHITICKVQIEFFLPYKNQIKKSKEQVALIFKEYHNNFLPVHFENIIFEK